MTRTEQTQIELAGEVSTTESNKVGPLQKRVLFSSFLGWMFDGFETSTLILVGIAAVRSLLPGAGADEIRISVGIALGGTLIGWAFGGTIGSIMADYVGRKKMLMISISGYCVFTGLSALSNSITMLIVLRFLTGIFLGTEWSTGTALVAETWPTSARAKALGVMQSGYGAGFFIAAALWLFIQPMTGAGGWRWMFVIGVLPAVVLLYIRRQVPESKLWLEAVAHEQQAARRHGGVARKFTVLKVFEEKGALAKVAAVLVLASVTVSVFYGITALIGPHFGAIAAKQGLVASKWASISALVYNGGSILGYVSAGFISDAIGRKPYMYFSFSGAIFAGVLMYFCPPSLSAELCCVFVLGTFTLGVFSWMPIYLPELFHTNVRATASGLIFNLARLVSFPMPILTAFLFSSLGGYQPTVLALTLLYVFAIAALTTLPETKGRPLPA